MAFRFDGSTDRLTRATVPAPFTVTLWANLTTDRNDYSTLWTADDNAVGGGGTSSSLQCGNDGTTLGLWNNSAYVGSRTLTPGQWFFAAVAFAANGTSFNWYHANLGDTTLYNASGTFGGTARNNVNHHFGNNAFTEWLNGRLAYIKLTNAELTAAQIWQEMHLIRPVMMTPYAWWPGLGGAADLVDYSGNGRTITAGGTVTTEDGPPVSYGAPVWVVQMPVGGGGGAYTLEADAGSYTITGQTTTLLVKRNLAADAGSYTITGADPKLLRGFPLSLDAGTYAITGHDVTFARTYVLAADAGSYTVTGQTASLLHDRVLALDAGSYTITGKDPTLTYTPASNYVMAVDTGVYTITGQDATLLVARKMAVDAGSYTITGKDVTLRRGLVMAVETGTYVLTGQAIALLWAHVLAADAGSYTLAGKAVTLSWSGEEELPVPDEQTFVIGAENRVMVIRNENRVFVIGAENRTYRIRR